RSLRIALEELLHGSRVAVLHPPQHVVIGIRTGQSLSPGPGPIRPACDAAWSRSADPDPLKTPSCRLEALADYLAARPREQSRAVRKAVSATETQGLHDDGRRFGVTVQFPCWPRSCGAGRPDR